MLIKQKSTSLPRNLALGTSGRFPIKFLTKVNLLYLLYSMAQSVLFCISDKAKLFAENFSKNSNLDDSGISLHVFPSRTNLRLHNISLTPKMVKKVIANLDLSSQDIWSWLYSSRGSKELRAWTFLHNMLNSSVSVWRALVFQIVGRFHWWSLYLRMLGKSLQLKPTTLLVFFMWLAKSLKNL